tara:strand:- start:94 stop:306 length:213 start_codon:yes stop_codon:yes gene_type:complete
MSKFNIWTPESGDKVGDDPIRTVDAISLDDATQIARREFKQFTIQVAAPFEDDGSARAEFKSDWAWVLPQ